jgi:hypothetical protein
MVRCGHASCGLVVQAAPLLFSVLVYPHTVSGKPHYPGEGSQATEQGKRASA